MERTVAIAGLGAIGLEVAKLLDGGAVEGLRLTAASARDQAKAQANLAGFREPPRLVPMEALAEEAAIIVDCAPAAVFEQVAAPAIARGRLFIPASVGALLPRMHLVEAARRSGARIIVPTGALLGLDAVRAAAEGPVSSVVIETRKPPRGLEGAPYLAEHGLDMGSITTDTLVFKGHALEAARGFPANVNVAAALALAGIGPERTMVEIWAIPGLARNTHTIKVEADAARFTMAIEGVPSESNPRTGKLTPLSIIACLRGLFSTLKVGS